MEIQNSFVENGLPWPTRLMSPELFQQRLGTLIYNFAEGVLTWQEARATFFPLWSVQLGEQCRCYSACQSCQTLCQTQTPGLQHVRLPCPSLSPRVCSNSCLLNQRCHPAISSSATFSFGLQSFPASGSFPMSWLFASGGSQSTGTSASASVLPTNTEGWFQNSSFEYCISPLTQGYWSFVNLFVLSFFLNWLPTCVILGTRELAMQREIIQNFNCEWKDGLKEWNRKKPGS